MAETGKTEIRAPALQRVRVRLIPLQDRLLIDGGVRQAEASKEEQIAKWLTRSAALPLFQQLRSSLEKGSATAGKLTVGWRQEALALEHAAILKTSAGKGPGAPWRGETKP